MEVNLGGAEDPPVVLHIVRHIRRDGELLKERKEKGDHASPAKRLAYCQKENQRIRAAPAAKKKKVEEEKERALLRIPNAWILSEFKQNIVDYCENELQNYVVRKQVEVLAVTTFTHGGLDEYDKDNLGNVVQYTKSGN